MARTPVGRELRRARGAVALLFLINASTYANVVPRLPAIKADLGLTNAALGTAVAALPMGALLSGPAAGWLVARYGSGRVATACGFGFGAVLPLFALAPSWPALAATFLALGLVDSLMDVSMNSHALRVQRGYGRSIVSAMHGVWSLGAVAGGLAGSVAAGRGLDLVVHLVVAGVVLVALTSVARRWVLPGPDDQERGDPALATPMPATAGQAPPAVAAGPAPELADATDAGGDGSEDASVARVVAVPHGEVVSPPVGRAGGFGRHLLWLGLLVLLAGVVEDAPSSWGAVLLRDELGTSAGSAGLAFLACQGAMTVGRLSGDRVVDRIGAVTAVRVGGALVLVGPAVGLLVGSPASVVVGFAVAGFGAAPLFPLVFLAAGNLPGVSTGHGVAAVAWMSRLGFLLVPPLVGLVADATSVRAGLTVVPLAGLGVVLLAGVVRPGAGEALR